MYSKIRDLLPVSNKGLVLAGTAPEFPYFTILPYNVTPLNSFTSVFAGLSIIYLTTYVIYNLKFHPLSGYPGPWLARSTLLWRVYHSMTGKFHQVLEKQHKMYGEVFRVSPNELSFCSNQSWRDIYGFKSDKQGSLTHVKSNFYDIYASGYSTKCIGSEQNPQKHSAMKKRLSPIFSAKSIHGQESLLRMCIERFMSHLESLKALRGPPVLDMTRWYEMIAFDIFGEMAFGESFHAIEEGKPHFWPSLIVDHLFFITLMDNLRRYPLLLQLASLIAPRLTVAVRNRHSYYTKSHLDQRLKNKTRREDFVTPLVEQVESGMMDKDELLSHVSTLVIAGGETTSTFLASTTYYLLRSPDSLSKVVDEVRSVFNSYQDITAVKAENLPYLQAVISEGLRIHPPGSHGFPRVSSGAFVDGHWIPAGSLRVYVLYFLNKFSYRANKECQTEIYTSAWTVTHREDYFHKPYEFLPERWISKTSKDVLGASRPFSLGPRECLGKNFALLQISLLLTMILYKYDLELVTRDLNWLEATRLHVMWAKPQLLVKFKPRAT